MIIIFVGRLSMKATLLGYQFPKGNSLLDPLPILTGPAGEYWQPFQAWHAAQRFLLTKNEGHSVNSSADNKLLSADVIDVAAVYPRAVFLPRARLIVNLLRHLHVSYASTRHLAMDNANNRLVHWYSLLTNIPTNFHSPSPQSPGTPSSPNDAHDMALAFATVLHTVDRESVSPSEKKASKDTDEVKRQYRLLFAHNGCSNTKDAEHLIPATLSKEFLSCLDAMKEMCVKTFEETFATFLTSLDDSDIAVDQGGNTWHKSQFDTPFCNALHKFHWLDCPLNRERTSIGHKISSVHFFPVDPNLADFQDRVQLDLELRLQQQANKDKSKMSKKETILYYRGLQQTAGTSKL
jgi:hypothetical protein